jgi:hypothetical protein
MAVSANAKPENARGIEFAKGTSIGVCDSPECGCNAVYIQLLDDRMEIFAIGALPPEAALTYAEDLRRVALKKLGGLQ